MVYHVKLDGKVIAARRFGNYAYTILFFVAIVKQRSDAPFAVGYSRGETIHHNVSHLKPFHRLNIARRKA
jgi:hypothetical protein